MLRIVADTIRSNPPIICGRGLMFLRELSYYNYYKCEYIWDSYEYIRMHTDKMLDYIPFDTIIILCLDTDRHL